MQIRLGNLKPQYLHSCMTYGQKVIFGSKNDYLGKFVVESPEDEKHKFPKISDNNASINSKREHCPGETPGVLHLFLTRVPGICTI